jgi:hypothetical protein
VSILSLILFITIDIVYCIIIYGISFVCALCCCISQTASYRHVHMTQFQDLKSPVTTILGLIMQVKKTRTYYVILLRGACGNDGLEKIDLQTLIPQVSDCQHVILLLGNIQ